MESRMDAKDAVEYLRANDVPALVNTLVDHLLITRPEGGQEVKKKLAEHALALLCDEDRALVASLHVPNQILVRPRRTGTIAKLTKALSVDKLEGSTGNIQASPIWARATKIIATLGPATTTQESMKALLRAGMNVARINLNHGDYETHRRMIETLRAASEETGFPVAVAVDIMGSEIRIGRVPGGSHVFSAGDTLVLTTDEAFNNAPTEDRLYLQRPEVAAQICVSQHIHLSGGFLELVVRSIKDTSNGNRELHCEVRSGHVIYSDSIATFPGIQPPHLELNKEDLNFAMDHGICIVFCAVQCPKDVFNVRSAFAERDKEVKVIAKIQNSAAIEQFESILDVADGILIDRFGLGAQLPLSRLFLCQKTLINKCNVTGKPVIVASQLMHSMITDRRPTRAEASDVANAVLDGVDALVLAGETAVGQFGPDAVEIVADICCQAEKSLNVDQLFKAMVEAQESPCKLEEAIATSAVTSAFELKAKAIIALSTKGSLPRLLSKYFPPCPIFVGCQTKYTADYSMLVRSVVPHFYPGIEVSNREYRLDQTMEHAKRVHACQKGDTVVLVHADLFLPPQGYANVARVCTVE